MEVYKEMVQALPEQAERMIFLTVGAFTPGARDFQARISNLRVEKPVNIPNLRRWSGSSCDSGAALLECD